ncbi:MULTISPECIES: hypothetical protein [Streptomyces]|uniref:hypothetical protein n=1 Tax=Streptomyces TaxID=1883 RepID=UPI000B254D6C|nr:MULTISPECIES: hypothetical protein [Streptomyces]MCR8942305.1 hypothetical protein [Streptomyces sp. OUCMDZ-4982]MDI7786158.1 hypothetical protein [Streptomyces cavourensis]
MTTSDTAMDPPAHLMSVPELPEPVEGCGVCQALDAQRREARGRGDYSAATDASVEIRRHPHATGTLR